MRTFISFFLYSSLFSFFIGLTKNQCTLNFPENVLLRPQILKFSGARETKIDHCPCSRTLELKNGDYVIATCYLFDVDRFYNISQMTLQCVNDRVIEKLSGNSMDSIELKCIRPPFHMHRSTALDNGYYEEFPWCPRSSLFFLHASTESIKADVFTGVLCYDIRLSSAKVLYYEYVPSQDRELLPRTVPATYVGEEHDNAVPKDQKLMLSRHYENEEFRHWFNFGQFEYASTVPESVSEELRENLGSLFNIMWWSYLRMGNWKRYQDKLREYVVNSGGMKILSGTFGEVRVPVNETGRYNQFVMSALKDDSDRKIFEYIWNDLEPRQEGEKHVVIFGFNSPFYEFFPENDIVFCKSMCEEIGWLAGIQKTFRYPNMGVIFCCLHEDVVKLNLIEGLGKKILSPPDFEKPKGCCFYDENDSSEHEDLDDSQESNELDYPLDKSVDSSFEWGKLKLTKGFGKKIRSPPDCESPNGCSYSDENDSSEDEDLDNSRERNQLDNGADESVETSFEQGGRRKGCDESCRDEHRCERNYVKSGKKSHRNDHHGNGCHKCHQGSCRSGNHPHRRDHHCRNSDESYEDSRERNQLDNEWDESTERSCERTHPHRHCAESGKNSHRSDHHGKGCHKCHQGSCRSSKHPHRRGHRCTNLDESYEDSSEEDQHNRHAHESGQGLRERYHHGRNSDESYEDSRERNQLDNEWDESTECSCERTHPHRHCAESGKNSHRSGHHGKGCHKFHRESCRSGNHPHRRGHHCTNLDESCEDSSEEDQHNRHAHESSQSLRERNHHGRNSDESHEDSPEEDQYNRNAHESGSRERNHHGRNSDESHEDSPEEDQHSINAHESGEGSREWNNHRNSDESYEDSRERNQLDNEWDESTECSCERTHPHRHCAESGKNSHRSGHHGKGCHKFHRESCRSCNHPHRRGHHCTNLDESYEDSSEEDQHYRHAHESGQGLRESNHHGRNSDESHEDSPKGDQHNRKAQESDEGFPERNHHGRNSDESHEDSPEEDQHNSNAHESGQGARESNHHGRNSDESHEESPKGEQHNRNTHESGEGPRERNLHGRNSDESHEDSPEEDQQNRNAHESGSRERNHHGRNSDESYEDSSEEDEHNRNLDESYEDSSEEYQPKRHAHQSWKRNHHGINSDESYEDSWEEDQHNRNLDESFEDSRGYWDELTENSPPRGRQTKNLAKSRQWRRQSGNDSPRQDHDDENWDESHKNSRKRHKNHNVWDDLRHLDEHDRKSHDRRLGTNSHRRNHHGRDYDKSYRKLGRKRSKYAENRNQRNRRGKY